MKFMKYIVLLSLAIGTINIHAMNKQSHQGLLFPQERVHRYLRNLNRRASVNAAYSRSINGWLRKETNARMKAEKEIDTIYAEVDKKAQEIRAAINRSILEKINLESLD